MKIKELIEELGFFDPESEFRFRVPFDESRGFISFEFYDLESIIGPVDDLSKPTIINIVPENEL